MLYNKLVNKELHYLIRIVTIMMMIMMIVRTKKNIKDFNNYPKIIELDRIQ